MKKFMYLSLSMLMLFSMPVFANEPTELPLSNVQASETKLELYNKYNDVIKEVQKYYDIEVSINYDEFNPELIGTLDEFKEHLMLYGQSQKEIKRRMEGSVPSYENSVNKIAFFSSSTKTKTVTAESGSKTLPVSMKVTVETQAVSGSQAIVGAIVSVSGTGWTTTKTSYKITGSARVDLEVYSSGQFIQNGITYYNATADGYFGINSAGVLS